ncbi:MAG: tRNA threonylcarbamoyladenosine dehydratase [Firmicutes bacterium]|nr:tRNA threonylcarbamoyladenosine dehydratase [Bacillota bacterium]
MFDRTEMLIGSEGLDILSNAEVIIFGIGGVGSYAAEALARAAIGRLILVDHDVIDITNLNRQIHGLQSTIGLPKVEVMSERIRDINPCCDVEVRREFYTPEKETDFFNQSYDYVLDAIDSVRAKLGLITACLQRQIPIISSMGAGNKLEPSGFHVVDIKDTYNDPLARVIRRRLRALGINKGLNVVFSPELPQTPIRGENGSTPASISFVPPVAGLVMAGFVIQKLLAGKVGHVKNS